MIIIHLHSLKNHWEYHLLYSVCQVTAISTTSAFGESAGLEKYCFLFLHMDQHRDISAAVAVAIRVRQHSSFSLLIAPKKSTVRILWSMTPNWNRKSGFISWLEFKAYVRIWTSCLSLQSFCFLFHSCCVACLDNKLFKVGTASYRTLVEYLVHGSNTGVFDQYKNTNPFFLARFLLLCQRISVCLRSGRVQGTHLKETTGNFYSPISSVAEDAHCSLVSLPSWRKHRANKVTSVFVLEMLERKMTAQELFPPRLLSCLL